MVNRSSSPRRARRRQHRRLWSTYWRRRARRLLGSLGVDKPEPPSVLAGRRRRAPRLMASSIGLRPRRLRHLSGSGTVAVRPVSRCLCVQGGAVFEHPLAMRSASFVLRWMRRRRSGGLRGWPYLEYDVDYALESGPPTSTAAPVRKWQDAAASGMLSVNEMGETHDVYCGDQQSQPDLLRVRRGPIGKYERSDRGRGCPAKGPSGCRCHQQSAL